MKNGYCGDEKIDIAAMKNRYRGEAIEASRRPLEKSWLRNNQQSRRWPEETANPNRKEHHLKMEEDRED